MTEPFDKLLIWIAYITLEEATKEFKSLMN